MTAGPLLRRSGADRAGRPWLIRPAVDADVPALVALRDAVAAEGGLVAAVPGERSALEEMLALDGLRHGGGLALVVEVDGAVAGQLLVSRRRGPHEGHVGDLGISLAAPHRGHGIGAALMETATGWARAVRLRKLCLTVFATNLPAIALYRARGFAEEGMQRSQVHLGGRDLDVLLMGLVLDRFDTAPPGGGPPPG